MIRYALACEHDHEFDGWFPSSAGFDTQVEAGEVLCPHCGSASVRKALMAPSIGKSSGKSASQDEAPSTPAAMAQKMSMMMLARKKHVEANCDYAGDAVAEEARRIHFGETEHPATHG